MKKKLFLALFVIVLLALTIFVSAETEKAHSYTYAPDDGDTHTGTCECGETVTEKHSFKTEITKPATCTTPGEQLVSCFCGYACYEVILPTGEHSFEYTSYDEETHTAVCECGETVTEEHTFEITVIEYETHWNAQKEEHNCKCGFSKLVVCVSTHSFFYTTRKVEVVAPTCTEQGYTVYACDCGETWKDDFVDPTGEHSFTYVANDGKTHTGTCECGETITAEHELETEIIKPATCEEAGEMLHTCFCGYACYETIWPIGEHSFTYVANDGKTHTGTCECGETITAEHELETEIIKPATCKEAGEMSQTCFCGYFGFEIIWPTGEHSFTYVANDGKTHTGTCECGETITAEHELETEIIKPATCKEAGEMSQTCFCGYFCFEIIWPTGNHTFGEWECLNDAAHIRRCACGEYEKAPHNFDEGVIIENPTHKEDGEKLFTCEDCGFERTEVIPRHGHKYVYQYINEKRHTKTCSCGESKTENHKWSHWQDTGDERKKVRYCPCGAVDYIGADKKDDRIDVTPNSGNLDKNDNKVKIDIIFDESTLNMVGVQIIPEILEQLNNMETEVNTDLGAIILDAIASSKIADTVGTISIGIQDITTDMEKKTGHRVFNITVNDENGEPLLPPSDSESNGTVTLSFKYYKGLTKEQVKIAYRDENGKLEHMEVEHYDPETGEVRFKTTHLSEYVIYTEEIDPSVYVQNFFEFKGYSINEATGSIGYGFTINYSAIEAYEKATGTTVDYGIVFASYELLCGEQPLNADGSKNSGYIVLKSSLKGFDYTSYDFVLTDITSDLYNHRFIVAAYAVTEDGVKYYQSAGASDTVEGVSYNTIQSILREQSEI